MDPLTVAAFQKLEVTGKQRELACTEKVAAKDKLIAKLQSNLSSAQNTASKLEV